MVQGHHLRLTAIIILTALFVAGILWLWDGLLTLPTN